MIPAVVVVLETPRPGRGPGRAGPGAAGCWDRLENSMRRQVVILDNATARVAVVVILSTGTPVSDGCYHVTTGCVNGAYKEYCCNWYYYFFNVCV